MHAPRPSPIQYLIDITNDIQRMLRDKQVDKPTLDLLYKQLQKSRELLQKRGEKVHDNLFGIPEEFEGFIVREN